LSDADGSYSGSEMLEEESDDSYTQGDPLSEEELAEVIEYLAREGSGDDYSAYDVSYDFSDNWR